MAEANIRAVITADDRASKTLSGVGKSISAVGKIAAVGLASAGAAAAAFGVMSVKAFTESEDATAQLNAVLKSTKGVAGVTSKAVLDLATSLQNVTKFADETIVGGQNLLLTFTKIGKDIFPQATETMLDMSQALGQDVKSSAVQLGKALQDPILGVTALRRVGVNFSKDQQEVIKKLVETGNIAKAQKLILKELSIEFGGSAKAAGETFSGQLEIAKNKLGDFMETVGMTLVNAMRPLLSYFIDLTSELGTLDDLLTKVKETLSTLGSTTLATEFLPYLKGFSTSLNKELLPSLQKLWNLLSPVLIPVLKAMAYVFGVSIVLSLKLLITTLTVANKAWAAFNTAVRVLYTIFLEVLKVFPNIAKEVAALARNVASSAQRIYNGLSEPWRKWADRAIGYINTVKNAFSNLSPITAGRNIVNKVSDLLPGFANGVQNFSGGAAWVGERGREKVILPKGSSVVPNHQLGDEGGGTVVNVNFSGVFTGNEMEFRKMAIKVFQAASDVAGMQNNDLTTQDWSRA